MADTKIEWADKVWNPVVGCSVISPGCTNCYAMRLAGRLEAMGSPIYKGHTTKTKAGFVWNGKVAASNWGQMIKPLSWKKPRRIFVNSMSDLFHKDMPDEVIDQVFAVMALCPQHTFLVLTKRSERMRKYMTLWPDGAARFHHVAYQAHQIRPGMKAGLPNGFVWELQKRWPLPNVWLGVSVEDQERANERIPDLLATPAGVRFLSCEPLLGPLDLETIPHPADPELSPCSACGSAVHINALTGAIYCESACDGPTLPCIDQVICGGESGPRKRPTDIAWHRSLRDQCQANGVAFFEKQIDKVLPIPEGLMIRQFPEVA